MKKLVFSLSLFAAICLVIASDVQNTPQKMPDNEIISQFIPGQIVVKFNTDVKPVISPQGSATLGISSLDEKMAKFNIKQLNERFRHRPIPAKSGLPDLSRIYRLNFPEDINPLVVAKAFSDDPNVEYAEPVYVCHIDEVPDDSLYSLQQFLPQIMAPGAWDIHKGQQGNVPVVIAIVDAGTDWLHEDLTENTWENLGEDYDGDGHTLRYSNGQWELDPGDLNGLDDDGNGFADDLIGWDFYEFETTGNGSDPDPVPGSPAENHGTHTAGIAAGRTDNYTGIASISWNLKYMPIQTDAGNNSLIYGYDGIIYAAENGADVINCSWGSSNYSMTAQDAVEYAVGLGSILVCSAGNNNNDELHYPSAYPGVISVASVNTYDQKASYSSFGPSVDISSPGGDYNPGILSTLPNNSYGYLNGTSMSSPLAAGLTGLIKSYHPVWTRDQVIQQLIGTCDNIDTINPDYEYLLGSGRINAYRALADTIINVPQQLKISLSNYTCTDFDGNGILEQDDTASLSLTFWNHAAYAGSENATFTMISYDPDIIMLSDEISCTIPEDNIFDLPDDFSLKISNNCPPHIAEILISVDADIPVVYGDTISIQLLVAPDGIFVFEGEEGHFDYSGSYIRMFLENIDQPVLYSTIYPDSFNGFDMVFLSFGNVGEVLSQGFLPSYERTLPIQDYAEQGGMIYLEVSGLFAGSIYFDYPNAAELRALFGVGSVGDHMYNTPVDTLTGLAGTPFDGMMFTESSQHYNWYVDRFTAAFGAYCTFEENDYGYVGINYNGNYGQKTSYFGYALAELKDVDATSSRYNFLLKTMEFFGYDPEPGYLIANFTSDVRVGGPGLSVNFKDISLTDEGYEINSWQWDFDNDGTINSYEQEPVWTFNTAGTHDVSLIVSNGTVTDTLLYPEYILINSGIYVFEAVEGGRDNSGSFIRDFLLENDYGVTYNAVTIPETLEGYDAVFLSYGNFGSYFLPLDDVSAFTILHYLENGGQVYLEGGDALGYDQVNNAALLDAFGLANAIDGQSNDIDSLQGLETSIMEDMFFGASNQQSSEWVDIYIPGTGIAAFEEAGYGIVGVQNGNPDPGPGPRTFCFSYAMAELQDGEDPDTREEIMWRILNFFDLVTGIHEQGEGLAGSLQLEVFPNPARENVSVSFFITGYNSNANLTIYDLEGRAVTMRPLSGLTKGWNQVSINLADLPPGAYLVRLVIGERIGVKKVLKF